jgi:AAA family ATP:ADP antiporter
MILFTLYIHTLLKGTKDTIIISKLGAELLSSVKLYGVMPAAMLFAILYAKLVNHFTRIQIHYFFIWFFISYFVIFAFILYPNIEYIHPDPRALIKAFPSLRYIFIMLANWSYTLFYIFSELWGNVMLALMFWQLVNQVYSVNEAKVDYPRLSFFGEVGTASSGVALMLLTYSHISSSWHDSLRYIAISIVIAGLFITASLYILSEYVVPKDILNGHSNIKERVKLSISESFKYVFTSKHIAFITLILFCYGASINLVEAVYKKQLSILYPNELDYGHFVAITQIATSVTAIVSILISSVILSKIRWWVGALITPIVMAITGIPFFMFIVFDDKFHSLSGVFGISVLYLSVLLGAAQNFLSKGIKYAFFEPTKEVLYIPLDEELKSKGKGVADVIGERLGKSFGSAMQWVMLSFSMGASLITITPYLFIIFIIVIIVWIFAIFAINKDLKH